MHSITTSSRRRTNKSVLISTSERHKKQSNPHPCMKLNRLKRIYTIKVKEIIHLLQESLAHKPIGQTKSFVWLATPMGIAALCRSKESINKPPFEEAIKEGVEVAIDLSREEREFHQTEKGLVLLFYS
tara:strand:+ start:248 stop:631 length:384 start_codon:yes stop_codon:yes gene_type:complete